MACFYQRLHTTGFSALVVDMQKVLGKSSLSNLPPERILDALFMARGGRGGDQDAINDIEAFLSLLPTKTGEALTSLATQLQSSFGQHELARPDRPAAPKKMKARP